MVDECVSPCQWRAEVHWQQLEERGRCSHCGAAQFLIPQRSWNWDMAGTARAAASRQWDETRGGGERLGKNCKDRHVSR